jgi:hypothetical protein
MTQVRFGLTLALLVGAAVGASAQPGGRPSAVVQFKQFGSTPEQFYQSSLARWTGELDLDLDAVKGDVAGARVPPGVRAAIGAQVDAAIAQTRELDQAVRRGAPRDKIYAAFTDVERAFGALTAALNQNPPVKLAAAVSLARADGAFQQLATAVGAGDNDPGRVKQRLIRLAEVIDDGAEELRTQAADLLNADRPTDRALAQYAREARLLGRRVRDAADPDTVKRTYEAMVARWVDAGALLVKVRPLPPAVLTQAQNVDGVHRRLGAVLNLPPYPPGVGPPAFVPGKQFAFAVGADTGAQPRVTVFADEKGTVAYNFFAYDLRFDGGVRVDMADLNGDGVPDLIVSPGPSKAGTAPPVRVYDGRDLNLLVEFVPFPAWKGGLFAAGTDLTKDGKALIAVTAEGTQHIKVFDLALGKEVDSFFAHDQKITGGVRLAWGDVNGDGAADLVTVNGPGNATTVVKVFNGKTREVLAEFPVLDNKYRGGGFVAAADLTGNGQANPVVGLDAGAAPLVRVFDVKGQVVVEWLAFDEKFRGGVRVAVSTSRHVVTGAGPGAKNSPLRVFHTGRLKNPPVEIIPFPGFDGGVNVGGR